MMLEDVTWSSKLCIGVKGAQNVPDFGVKASTTMSFLPSPYVVVNV